MSARRIPARRIPARRIPARLRRSALPAMLLVAAMAALIAAPAPPAVAAPPRASFTQIESDLMCVACHESLAVAQSPEAMSERQYVRTLIAQGLDRHQIENEMVQSYGPAVLALPPAHGFNVLVYIIPPLVLAFGIATVVFTLPRWRRRSRAAAAEPAHSPAPLDPADAQRLDEDLGRFA
ncbi:MAG TPA: cytochrome c-type biogenesis protein CcmH [Solirubrobacteraceae bacterium]|jgi:cytochrome c-type biogenesis protein CcmH|nr:cytochrome c-type biogenesis protein CcmH [Solirubrobacteraceae bacterium]